MIRPPKYALCVAAIAALTALCWSPPAWAIDWDGKTQQIVNNLDSSSSSVRLMALRKLGEMPLSACRKHILRSLEDTDFRVQREAARLAVEKKLKEARPHFQDWLAHWDERLRALGAEHLGELKDNSSVTTLVRSLTDPDPKVRLAVIKALGKLSSPGGKEITPLLGRLNDSATPIRKAVVEVLAKKKDKRVVIPLIARWKDTSRDVRAAVARALGELGDPGSGPTLMRMSRDFTETVAVEAIAALGKLQYEGATELLIDLLHGAKVRVRDKAAEALGQLNTDKALKALVGGLRNVSLRAAAQKALAKIGGKAARHLNELLQDPRTPRSMALAAVETARQARIRDTTPHIVAQLRLGRLSRTLLIRALGDIGDPRAQRPLLELLQSPSHEVRAEALKALERVVDQRAGEPLLRVLNDPDKAIRLRAVRMLGRLQVKIATPKLLGLASGKDLAVARSAVRALARAKDPRAIPALIKLLENRDRELRRLSGQALARMGQPGPAHAILGLCKRSSGARRITCIQALGGVLRGKTHKAALPYLLGVMAERDRSAFFAVVDALAAMDDAEIQPALMDRYGQLKLSQRRRVVEMLGNLKANASERTLPFLLDVLKASDPSLRAAAAWALGKLGDPKAELALRRAVKDKHWSVKVNATASLARLKSRKSLSLFKRLAGSRNPYLRANALLGIRALGDKGAKELLTKRLREDLNPWVRLNALRALVTLGFDKVKLGDKELTTTKALQKHVSKQDPDARVRRAIRAMIKRKTTASTGHWIGLYLLNMERKPLRSSAFVLVLPSGLLKASTSNPLGESWEEGILEGRCFVEAPHMDSSGG